MDYLASWLFTTSYSSKNSRFNLRLASARDFASLLHASVSRALPGAPAPRSPRPHDDLQSAPEHPAVSLLLEQLTAQLVDAFDQLRLERHASPQSSTHWHKLTGEMLAYARVTALLENMRCGAPSSLAEE